MINSRVRVFDLLDGGRDAKFVQHHGEEVIEVNYRSFIREAREVAKGLMSIGICKGDSVLLQLKNGYEWNLLDRAIQMTGAIQVSIGIESDNALVCRVAQETIPKCCFTDSPFCKRRLEDLLERLSIRSQIQLVKKGAFLSLLETASGSSESSSDLLLSNRMAEVSANDTACIIYTSGTTDQPKGVKLTHRNLVTSIATFAKYLGLMQGRKTFSLLPLSFCGERKMNYAYQYLGYEIHYGNLRKGVISNCNFIKPELIAVVPYILTQILEQAQLNRDNWLPRTIICGGASVDPFIFQKLKELGVEVFEVYGLTETTSLLAVNFPDNVETGTVGKPIKEIEVMVNNSGEVLTRGAHVAKGYVGSQEFPLDEKGWFHTGDIGVLTKEGYLKLTGRLKNRIRLSKGLDVAPEPIEAKLKADENVHNVFLFGRNRDVLVAIVQARTIEDSIDQSIELLVMEHNGLCKLIERIENHRIVTDRWNTRNGLLTATGKLNRPKLEKKYEDLLLEMYYEINSRTC